MNNPLLSHSTMAACLVNTAGLLLAWQSGHIIVCSQANCDHKFHDPTDSTYLLLCCEFSHYYLLLLSISHPKNLLHSIMTPTPIYAVLTFTCLPISLTKLFTGLMATTTMLAQYSHHRHPYTNATIDGITLSC